MRFPFQELDITSYKSKIQHLLNDDECHIFIDTNILSQLFKLNSKARHDFFSWVNGCGNRFHVPNWAVMEYSKHVYAQKCDEYINELKISKDLSSSLERLQRFFYGYVDEEELRSTSYDGNTQGLLNDMDALCDRYSKIVSSVLVKKSEHIKQVQKEIDDSLRNLVMDTDIYKIIGNLYFDYQLRLDGKVPPGFEDNGKATNKIGDLIIWNEILQYCKVNSISKVIFITDDRKSDMSYYPQIQTLDSHLVQSSEREKVAHESLVYEFKLTTNSEEFYSINFYMLVSILSSTFTELAFSFQLVSRDAPMASSDDEILADQIVGEENLEQPDVAVENPEADVDPEERNYTLNALQDNSYMENCPDQELKSCINGLKSHNWYTQNDAVYDFRKLLTKNWQDTPENRDSFFVIGRNLLQSADGNAFEAVRFINNLASILGEKPQFIKYSIVDGCLYEVFFDSDGKIRNKAFKGSYYNEVVKQAKDLILDETFAFINHKLDEVDDRFVPKVGGEDEYVFKFNVGEANDGLGNCQPLSLEINGVDNSASFSKRSMSFFANVDDIKRRLSSYYAVPENSIHIEGLPQDIESLFYIKEEEDIEDIINDIV